MLTHGSGSPALARNLLNPFSDFLNGKSKGQFEIVNTQYGSLFK